MEWRFREDDLQIFLRLKAKLEQIWPQVPSSDSSYYVPMLEEEIDQSSSLLDWGICNSTNERIFIALNEFWYIWSRDAHKGLF